MPPQQREQMIQGRHPADPRRIGATIPVIGGIVFVASNGEAVGSPWRWVLLALIVALAAVALWGLHVRRTPLGRPAQLGTSSWFAYLGSVAFMLVGINLASQWAASLGHEAVRPAIIATFVGLHFLPFAWAFKVPMIALLGVVVAALGGLGVLLGITVDHSMAVWLTIVAGFAQIAVIVAWVLRTPSP